MKPKVTKSAGLSQLRYALPYQIHASDVYPLLSPNGSSILVCGHEHGLLFVWRGGRPFKPPKPQPKPQSTEDVIVIDNDDEDENIPPAEFAEEEEDFDPSAPYSPIIQKLELPLGTAVLHIAFPRLPQLPRPQAHPLVPNLLQRKMVIALTCADSSVRLLTMPLTPPSPALLASKKLSEDIFLAVAGRGTWGEELVTIPTAHQSLPRGIALTFAPRQLTRDDPTDTDDKTTGFDALLASHSADISGMLHVHRIPLDKKSQGLDTASGRPSVWRSRPLSASAASIDIFASTSSSQSPRVLVAESTGTVRVFECVTSQAPDRGRWTFSLFSPPANRLLSRSETVVSARWVLSGQAVAILNVEGEWGIWDISSLSGNRTISGSMPTPFTIGGRVGTIIASTTGTKSSNSGSENRSSLAPMTPSTRKARQDMLFSGKGELFSKRGGISIKVTTASMITGDDESLLFWHGERAILIPSLQTHWRNKFRGTSSIFIGSANGQARDIAPLALQGELRTAVSAFPMEDSSNASNVKHLDILIAGERSFTIQAAPLISKESTESALALGQERDDDQTLLAGGQLGVDGLDRMLDTMASVGGTNFGSSAPRSNSRIQFR